MATPDERRFRYHIDGDDRISFVSAEWLAFAVENDASHLTTDRVLGTSIWDVIADAHTRAVYGTLFNQLRSGRSTATIPFQCDSPGARRFMELTLRSIDGVSIELSATVVSIVSRAPVRLFDVRRPRSAERWTTCSFCKRVRADGLGWLDAEAATESLGLHDRAQLPRLLYSICDECEPELQDRLRW